MSKQRDLSPKEMMQQVARTTRDALYEQWEKGDYFWDYNNFYGKGQGILSEAMGLTSVMLMYIRFSKDEAVWGSVSNDFKTLEIVTKSLEFIYRSVTEEGYSVKPLCQNNDMSGVIDKEHGYIDTITWVLSSSVLVTYAIRKGMLSIDEDHKNYAFELLADSLAQLMDAQLENGSWGFSTDRGCKTSLYFTYAAATALADCFDYLMGELEYYGRKNDQKSDIKIFYDHETLEALNEYYRRDLEKPIIYYPTDSVENAINATRARLQEWLLKNLVPSLPRLSACASLNDEERARLGISKQQLSDDAIEEFGGKDYINLYYAFYAVDILTTSSTDKRYESIAKGEDVLSLQMLVDLYKSILSADDLDFYFISDEGAKAKDFLEEYIDQAIHATRLNFSTAQRTGEAFWNGDNKESELTIQWEHNSITSQRLRKARSKESFTEPTLVPMALRANTVYCFYITERADVIVDKMFDMICKDRSIDSKTEGKNTRVQDLWDGQNFSLPITERAIEALVDYCDYLEEFGERGGEQIASVVSVDDAVEEKIRQYLTSEKGKGLLGAVDSVAAQGVTVNMAEVEKIAEKKAQEIVSRELAAKSAKTVKSSQQIFEQLNSEEIEKLLSGITMYLQKANTLPGEKSAEPAERLAYQLLKLFEALSVTAIRDMIDIEGDTADAVVEDIHAQKVTLLREMARFSEEGRTGREIWQVYKENVEGD